MLPVNRLKSNILYWRQPKWRYDHFELSTQDNGKDKNELLGTITWTECLSETALAVSADGCWTFEEHGFLDPRIVILEEPTSSQDDKRRTSEIETAQVTFDWSGDATIKMADTTLYEWYKSKVISPAWIVADSKQEAIFEIELGYHWFKQEGVVRLSLSNLPSQHLDLLLLLGFYLAVYRQRKTTVVVAATAAIS